MITEPATTLTDYVMAALALGFSVDLRRRAAAARHARAWSAVFAFLAVSALAGGTFHGFRPHLAAWVAEALWRASLAAAALSSCAALRAIALQWLGRARGRPLEHLAFVKLAAALVTGAVHPEFVVVVADFGITLLFGLAAATLERSKDRRAFGLLCAGIGLFVLGAGVQQARVSPHPAFNHNDLFHGIQILGNTSVFLSARRIGGPGEQASRQRRRRSAPASTGNT